MAFKDPKTKIKIGKITYDVIYRSGITGNLSTFEDLQKGKIHPDDFRISPKSVFPEALRERTQKNDRRLIVDETGLEKERCGYCNYVKITEFANKRETWELGNSYPVLSSKVDFGISRYPRRRETSKYCDSCDRTYVKEKVVVAKYA